jgi:hypothetical protein
MKTAGLVWRINLKKRNNGAGSELTIFLKKDRLYINFFSDCDNVEKAEDAG